MKQCEGCKKDFPDKKVITKEDFADRYTIRSRCNDCWNELVWGMQKCIDGEGK